MDYKVRRSWTVDTNPKMDAKPKTALISLLCLLTTVHCTSRWIFTVQLSESWMSGYTGKVNICFTFSANNSVEVPDPSAEPLRECSILPWRRFDRGQTYRTSLEFNSSDDGVPTSASMWTSGCGVPRSDKMRVGPLSVHNLLTGWKFSYNPQSGWTVPRSCDTGIDLALDAEISPRPCPAFDGDGSIHLDGEDFYMGCRSKCKCVDGSIRCVPACSPFMAPGCPSVYEPGECCQRPACSLGSCVTAEANDCEAANRTVGLGEVPWAVFIKACEVNSTKCERACSGSLISEEWVLTSSECVRGTTADRVRLILGELSIVVAEDAEVEYRAEEVHVNRGLALVRLPSRIDFDRTVQPVALPGDREACLRLAEPSCAVSLAGWISADSGSGPSYELYKLSTSIEEFSTCGAVPRRGKGRRDMSQLCLSLTDDEPLVTEDQESEPDAEGSAMRCANEKRSYMCSEQQGLGLVSKALDRYWDTGSNFLVGVISYSLPDNTTTEEVCHRPAYRLAVSVCHHLQWISSTLTTVE